MHRWIMYNHRILSFVLLTSTFWLVEVCTALLLWLAFSFAFAPASTPPPPLAAPKDDDTDLSDAPRAFPSVRGQPALRYSPALKYEDVKPEPSEPGLGLGLADADDEDEDADFVLDPAAHARLDLHDSGLGTSVESGAERAEALRWRRGAPSGSK